MCKDQIDFKEEFLKAKFGVRATECLAFFWLVDDEVTGWCSRNLVLGLRLTTFSWVEALVLKELKDSLLCIFLEEELAFTFIAALVFLDCFSFVSVFSHLPNE